MAVQQPTAGEWLGAKCLLLADREIHHDYQHNWAVSSKLGQGLNSPWWMNFSLFFPESVFSRSEKGRPGYRAQTETSAKPAVVKQWCAVPCAVRLALNSQTHKIRLKTRQKSKLFGPNCGSGWYSQSGQVGCFFFNWIEIELTEKAAQVKKGGGEPFVLLWQQLR